VLHRRDPHDCRIAALNAIVIHTLFEILAYAVGVRLYLVLQRRQPTPALVDRTARLAVMTGAVLGAVLGAKLAYWLEDPVNAFAGFPDVRQLMQGKSIVGGLLGGLVGVEFAKWRLGLRASTGDGFIWPLAIGVAIGRIGCHLAGPGDHTAGLPTALPWGYDYGDGIPRHPTALYEIPVLLFIAGVVARWRAPPAGDRIRAFMVGYLVWRLAIEWLKPMPFVYLGALSGIQLLCIAGIGYYCRDIVRWLQRKPGDDWARS
jgi:phosphatidylglycerol:prolipoprotein diacylglycerol transferase